MKSYIYQGTLLCDECGPNVRDNLKHDGRAPRPDEEFFSASDDYPFGPVPDCVGHCDRCGIEINNLEYAYELATKEKA